MAVSPGAESSRSFELDLSRSSTPQSNSSSTISTLFTNHNAEKELGPWLKYLVDTPEADELAKSINLFNLEEQNIIDEDCRNIIDELDVSEDRESAVFSILRTIITIYSKSENKKYSSDNGWIELLGQLVSKDRPILSIYIAFKKIRQIYIPEIGIHGFILRLLLRYHDPELCHALDSSKISLVKPTKIWMNSLFVKTCSLSVCQSLWKFFFRTQTKTSYRLFFVALSIIITYRNDIMTSNFNENRKVESTIEFLPRLINQKNIKDIIEFAKTYDTNTPPFFKELFDPYVYGKERGLKPHTLPKYLPTAADHVIDSIKSVSSIKPLNYIIADCRSYESFMNDGRFDFTYSCYIDCDIMTSTLEKLDTIKKGHLSKVKKRQMNDQKSELRHICLMGSGLQDDDDCIRTIAAALIKDGTKYVSIIYGGYKAVHTTLKFKEKMHYLIEHKKKCSFCKLELPSKSPSEINFNDNIDTSFKQRFAKARKNIRKQLFTCVNPSDPSCKIKSKKARNDTNINDQIYEDVEPIYSNQSIINSNDTHGALDVRSITSSNMSSKRNDLQAKPNSKSSIMNSFFERLRRKKKEKNEFKGYLLLDDQFYKSRIIIENKTLMIWKKINRFSKKELLIINCSITDISKVRYKYNYVTIYFNQIKGHPTPFEIMKILMNDGKKFVKRIEEEKKK